MNITSGTVVQNPYCRRECYDLYQGTDLADEKKVRDREIK